MPHATLFSNLLQHLKKHLLSFMFCLLSGLYFSPCFPENLFVYHLYFHTLKHDCYHVVLLYIWWMSEPMHAWTVPAGISNRPRERYRLYKPKYCGSQNEELLFVLTLNPAQWKRTTVTICFRLIETWPSKSTVSMPDSSELLPLPIRICSLPKFFHHCQCDLLKHNRAKLSQISLLIYTTSKFK